jgi:LysM repeat protein
MEVLMSRSRSSLRTSQSLFAILAIVIVVGLLIYAFKGRSTPQDATASPSTPPIESLVNQATNPAIAVSDPSTSSLNPQGVAVSQTPTVRPAAAPAQQSPGTASPSTQPSGTWDALAGRNNPPPRPVSSNPLADAQALVQSGDLVNARAILNEAVLSNSLSPNDIAAAKTQLRDINQTLVFSPKRISGDPFVGSYTIKSGETLKKIADQYEVPWEFLARINNISDARKIRAGQTIKVVQGPFHGIINKTAFTMEIYLGSPGESGSMFVTSYPVGLGKEDSTPSGIWIVRIGGKLKNPKFWGAGDLKPMEADDPNNPLGERWIALDGLESHLEGKTSYGIHGTIDPKSIGKMESLGCIRLRNEDVDVVYDMLFEGKSKVIVRN